MPEAPATTESEAKKLLRARLETKQQAIKDLEASKPDKKTSVNERQFAEDMFNFQNRMERLKSEALSFEGQLKEAK